MHTMPHRLRWAVASIMFVTGTLPFFLPVVPLSRGGPEYGVSGKSCNLSYSNTSIYDSNLLTGCACADGFPKDMVGMPFSFSFEASPLYELNNTNSAPNLLMSTTGVQVAAAADETEMELSGFNWRAYLMRNPDLRAAGLRTASAAWQHYLGQGRAMNRQHDRIPVVLRYSACQGLFNQMYAHLNAFMLADVLDADVVVPPALYRESFSKHFSLNQELNEVKWTPTATAAVLDMDYLRVYKAKRGWCC